VSSSDADDGNERWLDDETSPEAVAEEKRLADELRRIIHRLVLVRPDAEDLRRAADGAKDFADALDRLRPRGGTGEVSEAGLRPNDPIRHSPLSGTSNPLAPPMVSRQLPEGEDGPDGRRTEGTVRFGAAYEGPPRHVHGGLLAAMFDELLGRSQLVPGFTGSLTVWYRRPTPLDRDLQLKAWVDRVEGRKRWIRGTCHLDGVLLSEAEGLFIAPREGGNLQGILASLARNSAAQGGERR
jgi:hypothetical protein